MQEFIDWGKRIYDLNNSREKRRFFIFVGRVIFHRKTMRELLAWFKADDLRRKLLARNPFPLEQATRAFFYDESTIDDRVKLIKAHISFLQDNFSPEIFLQLAGLTNETIEVWRSEYNGEVWHAVLKNEPGQRKEGMLSLEMNLGRNHLYQIMFWINADKNGDISLWIGALQGPNVPDARELIKEITKYSHRYRTKNLMLYMLQAVARSLGMKHIYAVSNEGYYANNHLRRDRKIKTDFGAFWQEAGGSITDDRRFYELPLTEPRKRAEEIPTRKRADYRRRFEFQDAIDAEIAANMQNLLGSKA